MIFVKDIYMTVHKVNCITILTCITSSMVLLSLRGHVLIVHFRNREWVKADFVLT